jgi:hypothetical protein
MLSLSSNSMATRSGSSLVGVITLTVMEWGLGGWKAGACGTRIGASLVDPNAAWWIGWPLPLI